MVGALMGFPYSWMRPGLTPGCTLYRQFTILRGTAAISRHADFFQSHAQWYPRQDKQIEIPDFSR
jgi:hypothetical protein